MQILFDFEKGEILLVNKPYRWTSFDVIGSIRYFFKKELGIKKFKIGHAGTLDPLATGLLILCTGPATKRIEEFKDFDKEYTGTFTLGATTASFDLEKPIDQTYPIEHITEEMISKAAISLTGNIEQVPPVFSAIKVNGKRAYKYARNEQEVVLKSRSVSIPLFEITRIALPEVDFRIVCSKGTYIRSVARDFGLALESGAYLSALCRTRVGPHELKDAYEVDQLKELILSQQPVQPDSQLEASITE
ncbi:MAG: tRNA pseudouridine(55) synthase TruB [Bacteroidales bacterium]|nr:tRNA pseudouridine(55) synthase TruB [Bacteroidales bacterium]MBK7173193.1 tRNA pseudouridine(55) synthase TruB [Bacteroidales bacterium]